MKNLKLLTSLKLFFQKVNKSWKSKFITFAILLLLSGVIIALVVNKETLFYKITFAIFVISITTLVFLLFSFIIVPILDFKIRGARAWFNWSSSRLLPVTYRIKAWMGLNELKNYSDYSFSKNTDTYIRLQILTKYLTFANPAEKHRHDGLMLLPYSDQPEIISFKYDNGSSVETLTLMIESKVFKKNNGAQAVAKLLPKENPNISEFNSADAVELFLGKSTLITYGFNSVDSNGNTQETAEAVLAITWLGGKI